MLGFYVCNNDNNINITVYNKLDRLFKTAINNFNNRYSVLFAELCAYTPIATNNDKEAWINIYRFRSLMVELIKRGSGNSKCYNLERITVEKKWAEILLDAKTRWNIDADKMDAKSTSDILKIINQCDDEILKPSFAYKTNSYVQNFVSKWLNISNDQTPPAFIDLSAFNITNEKRLFQLIIDDISNRTEMCFIDISYYILVADNKTTSRFIKDIDDPVCKRFAKFLAASARKSNHGHGLRLCNIL